MKQINDENKMVLITRRDTRSWALSPSSVFNRSLFFRSGMRLGREAEERGGAPQCATVQ